MWNKKERRTEREKLQERQIVKNTENNTNRASFGKRAENTASPREGRFIVEMNEEATKQHDADCH